MEFIGDGPALLVSATRTAIWNPVAKRDAYAKFALVGESKCRFFFHSSLFYFAGEPSVIYYAGSRLYMFLLSFLLLKIIRQNRVCMSFDQRFQGLALADNWPSLSAGIREEIKKKKK